MKDEGAVDLWPDMDDAAQACLNGETEQDADARGSFFVRSQPVEAKVPPEQQDGAHDRGEHTEHTSLPAGQHGMTEEHAGDQPEEMSQQGLTGEHAALEPEEAGMTGEHARGEPEADSQHGSEEDDRLEELMGAVPTINLRELRTQVASLPEILSRAERTAELCARGSAPAGPGLQGQSPHKLTDGSIHSWVAQSRATAILSQREHHLTRHPHSSFTEAAQPRHSQGEAERDALRHGEECAGRAEGSTAGSLENLQPGVPRRLTARRSLAEVRAAIGIVPCPEAIATGYDTL